MAISGVSTANGVTALPQALLQVYSAEIMHRALPAMRYEQFAVVSQEPVHDDEGGRGVFKVLESVDANDYVSSGFGWDPGCECT